jgi:N-acyl homoserine lactone hydrolase
VVLTHAHYDHAVNFTLFPNATVWIGREELSWASQQPAGFNPLPELYVRELAHSARVCRVDAQEEFLPGLQALAAPGHTPGHMLFYLHTNEVPILFTGDAAKNRAELMSRTVKDTEDEAASVHTLELIWARWRAKAGTILVPGHDLCMYLDDKGKPQYLGERKAAISAWFGEDLVTVTHLELSCGH